MPAIREKPTYDVYSDALVVLNITEATCTIWRHVVRSVKTRELI